MKNSEKAALKIIEVLTQRIANRLKAEFEGETTEDKIGSLAGDFGRLADAMEAKNETVAERMIDLAASCVIIVSSMVSDSAASELTNETPLINVEEAADKARRMMIERAQKSGLFIAPASTLDS